jgi:Protein of unknown function (DUF3768)
MCDANTSNAEAIRDLNDFFRRFFIGGKVMLTAGINALSEQQRRSIIQKVRSFSDFTEDNDPHEEHDFGVIEDDGVRCFWKIEYFSRDMTVGSPDPADDVVTARVMTIMLAEEY